MVKISVEYCGRWGYEPRFKELERQIKAEVPEAEVEGFIGRSTSFEVTIDNQVAFSKLERGAFPDFTEVVAVVKEAVKSGKVGTVVGTQTGGCTIS